HPILTNKKLKNILKNRDKKDLIIIDISVPRNIETGIKFPNLKIYDLDGFKAISEENRLRRLESIKEAKLIIQEAVEKEERYFRQQFLKPLVSSIYCKAEEVRRIELKKLIKLLDSPSSKDIRSLEKFSQVLISKIFAEFSSSLKTAAENSLISSISL
ncbi:MAG: hypothetical protein ACTSR3_04200, partial [Candidatus Helarchaeota archaeon]